MFTISTVPIAIIVVIIIICIWLLRIWWRKRMDRQLIIQLMIILGSGGHSAEMIRCLQDAFASAKNDDSAATTATTTAVLQLLTKRVYVVAETDRLSTAKAEQLERILCPDKISMTLTTARIRSIPRAREVGQSWLSSLWTFARALLSATVIVWQERPQLIVCNGPGTCVPVCLCARVFQWLGIGPPCRLVFVESFARVTRLSLTGRILYPLADEFIVQWPQLHQRYPRSHLMEGLL